MAAKHRKFCCRSRRSHQPRKKLKAAKRRNQKNCRKKRNSKKRKTCQAMSLKKALTKFSSLSNISKTDIQNRQFMRYLDVSRKILSEIRKANSRRELIEKARAAEKRRQEAHRRAHRCASGKKKQRRKSTRRRMCDVVNKLDRPKRKPKANTKHLASSSKEPQCNPQYLETPVDPNKCYTNASLTLGYNPPINNVLKESDRYTAMDVNNIKCEGCSMMKESEKWNWLFSWLKKGDKEIHASYSKTDETKTPEEQSKTKPADQVLAKSIKRFKNVKCAPNLIREPLKSFLGRRYAEGQQNLKKEFLYVPTKKGTKCDGRQH